MREREAQGKELKDLADVKQQLEGFQETVKLAEGKLKEMEGAYKEVLSC